MSLAQNQFEYHHLRSPLPYHLAGVATGTSFSLATRQVTHSRGLGPSQSGLRDSQSEFKKTKTHRSPYHLAGAGCHSAANLRRNSTQEGGELPLDIVPAASKPEQVFFLWYLHRYDIARHARSGQLAQYVIRQGSSTE